MQTEMTQINKEGNERGEITTVTTEIQKTMKEYYEQLYANKFDNLEEIDNFLETRSPLKLNQEEIDNLNRPITRNEIKSVGKINKKNCLQAKVQDQMASQVNSANHTKRSYTEPSQTLPKD